MAAISAALAIADAQKRDMIAAQLQHAFDLALAEDAAVIAPPK